MDVIPKINTRSGVYANFVFGLLVISIFEISWTRFANPLTSQLTKRFPLTGFDSIELRDKLSVAFLILLIPFCASFNFNIKSSQVKKFFWLVEIPTFLILLISLSWKTFYRPDLPQVMWEGFGISVAVCSLALILNAIIFRGKLLKLSLIIKNRIDAVFKILVSLILLTSYLPSVLSTPNGVTSIGAMRWSLNELIAPVTGKFPLSNFTSEYSSILGFPLIPFKLFLTNHQIPTATLIYINFLIIFQFLVMGLIVKKILPKISYIYCLFVSCSIPLVQHSANHEFSSSIVSALTATPSRTFLPVMGIISLIYWKENSTKTFAMATGSISALSAINNLEFGFPFGIVMMGLVIWCQIARNKYLDRKTIPVFYFAFITTPVLYFICADVFADGFDLRRYVVFVRAFGKNDFGSIPMPNFGLYVFIFCILGMSASLSLKATSWMRQTSAGDQSLEVAAMVGLVVGLWSSFALLYYAGRSTNAGQLQIFLIPLPLAIAVLIRLCNQGIAPLNFENLLSKAPLVVLLLCSLSISSVVQAPSPRNETNRLVHGRYDWSINSVINTPEGLAVSEFSKINTGVQIGYFGRYGNLVELALPVLNASSVNYPYDLWMSPLILEMACKDISRLNIDLIIIPKEDLPEKEVIGFCSSAGLNYVGNDSSNLLLIYDVTN